MGPGSGTTVPQQLSPFQPKRGRDAATTQALRGWGQRHPHSRSCCGRRCWLWGAGLVWWSPRSPSAGAGSTTWLTSGPRGRFGPEAPEQRLCGAQHASRQQSQGCKRDLGCFSHHMWCWTSRTSQDPFSPAAPTSQPSLGLGASHLPSPTTSVFTTSP